MNIETTQEDFKKCIAVAHQHKHGEEIDPDTIKDFLLDDRVKPDDIESLLLGSSLGQLAKDNKVFMARTV
jgi:hypothetical protein